MTEETESTADPDSGEPAGTGRKSARETAPMSEFGTRAVALGAIVLVVGLGIIVALSLLGP